MPGISLWCRGLWALPSPDIFQLSRPHVIAGGRHWRRILLCLLHTISLHLSYDIHQVHYSDFCQLTRMVLSVLPLHNCNCPTLHHDFEGVVILIVLIFIVNVINVRVVLTASVLVSIRVAAIFPQYDSWKWKCCGLKGSLLPTGSSNFAFLTNGKISSQKALLVCVKNRDSPGGV